MADPLIRRAKKWTYLTWCDLRNHPFMLLGCLIGALVFAIFAATTADNSKRIGGVERIVKVPRRCSVAKLPNAPPGVVILTCDPATKTEVKRAQRAAEKAARRRAARRARRSTPPKGSTGGQNGGSGSRGSPGNSNGNQGNPPSASNPPSPSSPPTGGSSPPSSGGGSSPPTSPAPSRPSPGITTPQVDAPGGITIPSFTVPLPNLSLPPPPPLPGS